MPSWSLPDAMAEEIRLYSELNAAKRLYNSDNINARRAAPQHLSEGYSMKSLQLKDVMQNLKVTITDTGYELACPAGTAQYDTRGARTTVNGVPEYFPISLSIKDERDLKVSTGEKVNNGGYYAAQVGIGIGETPDPLSEFFGEPKNKTVRTLSVKVEVDTAEAEAKLETLVGKARGASFAAAAAQGVLAAASVEKLRPIVREVILLELKAGGLLYRW